MFLGSMGLIIDWGGCSGGATQNRGKLSGESIIKIPQNLHYQNILQCIWNGNSWFIRLSICGTSTKYLIFCGENNSNQPIENTDK